ncbi:MAG TPA: epimerase [Candidatus Competibacteraceae bacterium]|nr:epimerase [Candidatus Competibacteraceae bacterium]
MRIFVTGATGVIGRRAVPLLVAAGHRVTAVARSAEKSAALRRAGADALAVDLLDPPALRTAVVGHEALVNLATHIPASTWRMFLPGAWRENDRLRRTASAYLVDAALAAGVGRFIQESFALTYPDCGDRWIDERAPIQPTRYNRTVANAEASARRFAEGGGAGIILRFAGFYGPDSFQSRDMIKLARKGWSPLLGSSEAFFSSITHDDAARAVVAALDVPAGAYNVTDDEPLRRREYASALAAALGVPPLRSLPAWVARLGGSLNELLSRSQRISNRALRDASGWEPTYPSAREGWREIVRATRDQRLGRISQLN